MLLRRLVAVGLRGLAHATLLTLVATALAQAASPARLLPEIEGWTLRLELAVESLEEWRTGDPALRQALANAGVIAFVQATYRSPEGFPFRIALHQHSSREAALGLVLAASRVLSNPVRSSIGEVSFIDSRRVLVVKGAYTLQVTALMSPDSLFALAARLTNALPGSQR